MEDQMPGDGKTPAQRAKQQERSKKSAVDLDDGSLDKVVGGRRAGTEVKDSHDRYANK
jgi:hypothetical protein